MENQRKTSEELLALQRIEELVRAIAKSILAERLNRYLEDRKFRILYENTGWLTRPELEKKRAFRQERFRVSGSSGNGRGSL